MKVKTFQNNEDWLAARRGRITGSRVSDIIVKRGTTEKIGFYQIIAERIATTPENENPMDRGHRLEQEAIDKFTKKTGKKVDTSLVIWERDDNASIAISPDGYIGETEAVEIKCLASSKHIKAKLTNEYPKEYTEQALQYFIVNEKLQTLHFVMYDPRMPEDLQILHFEIKRENIQEEVEKVHNYQVDKLAEIDRIVTELTF